MQFLLRKILVMLSFFFKNNLDKYSILDFKTKNEIIKILNNNNTVVKKNLTKTHKNFNYKLRAIFLKKKIISFLRFSFIQKMFFIHNRFFILKELNVLRADKKNWKLYEKLIKEDNVGDPVRYIFYPKSSGNRINQVYHLSVLIKFFNLDIKKISTVFEFGAGYGLMARIFLLANSSIRYFIFDTFYTNLLQYYYLKLLGYKPVFKFEKKKNINLLNNIKDLRKYNNKKNSLFIANWSLSETPLKFRVKFIKFIKNFDFILISFQEYFEKIDNLKYFNYLKNELSDLFDIKIVKNKYYKGNVFKKQNHYYFIAKKI
jgi:hypothetical protein